MPALLALMWMGAAVAQDAPAGEPAPETPNEAPEAQPVGEAEAPAEPAPAEAPAAAEPAPEPVAEPEPAPEPEPEPEPMILDLERPEKVATFSFSGEIGATHYGDESFDLFSSSDALGVRGLRAGYRLHPRLEAQVGWLHSAHGSRVEVASEVTRREQEFIAAYFADRFSLGLRADLTLDNALFLYAAGRGEIVLQQVRFDGDDQTKTNADQISASATAPGAELVGGVELRIPQGTMPLTVAWTLEMGGEIVSTAAFGDFGDLRSGGFVVHSGLGLRF